VTLRLRIFRLLEERRRVAPSDMPTVGQIAEALGEPVRSIFLTIQSSEVMGQVWLARGLNERDDEVPVMLKPPAFVYLEAAMNDT